MINFSRLKEIREDKDITQEEIAEYLNIPRSTYSMWEVSISIISIPYLSKLSDYYNYSIDYILGLNDNRKCENLIKGFDLKILSDNLRKIRKSHNLTQESLANILGVKQSCIYKYEKGLTCIPIQNLYKLCKEFNISINEICGKGKI